MLLVCVHVFKAGKLVLDSQLCALPQLRLFPPLLAFVSGLKFFVQGCAVMISEENLQPPLY